MMQQNTFKEQTDFIMNVGMLAHKYGATAMKVEIHINKLLSYFDLQGEIKVQSDRITFAFDMDNSTFQNMKTIKSIRGMDLGKLSTLEELLNELLSGNIALQNAKEEIKKIEFIKGYSDWIIAISYVLVGLGLCSFFKGSVIDLLFSGVLSLVVFWITKISTRLGFLWESLVPITSALLVSFSVVFINHTYANTTPITIIISSIAILLPGFTISLGVGELIYTRIENGFSNLIIGTIYLLKQVLGTAIGIYLGKLLFETSTAQVIPAPSWISFITIPGFSIGISIFFMTKTKDLSWSLLSCLITWICIIYGVEFWSNGFNNILTTFIITIFAEIWSVRTNRSNSIIYIPALMILVCSSAAFRGFVDIVVLNMELNGYKNVMKMYQTAIQITIGYAIGKLLFTAKFGK